MSWKELVRGLAHADPEETTVNALARTLNLRPESPVLGRMEWLGLFGDAPIRARKSTPLDILADLMTERLKYGEGERDMIILRHEFLAAFPDGTKEKIVSTLVDFGVPHGDSSMSRTVGLPAAMGARFILEGAIRETGIQTPVVPGIYEPILNELGRFGVRFAEERRPG
jgi:saccharopine dehydrogenase (NADP+, L-glutamate forming)